MIRHGLALVLALSMTAAVSLAQVPKSALPKNGAVPDEQTAIKIAEAVLLPVFGEDVLRSQMPFQGRLDKGVWTVYGKIESNKRGGTLLVRMQKVDGKIIEIRMSI